MYIITDVQGDVNQSDNEVSPQPVKMSSMEKSRNNECWQGCSEKRNSFTVEGSIIWFSLKKNSMTQSFYFLAAIPRTLKKKQHTNPKDICTALFIAVLFTMAKIQKQPKYPKTDEWK